MILVTGEKGLLSVAIKNYIVKSGLENTRCVSVRNDAAERIDFADVDTIVHVAGVVPKQGVRAEEFYKVNRDLTEKLAAKAKAGGVSHFIYISSMAVYGLDISLNPHLGTIGSDTPCHPVSDYGKSKLEAENLLIAMEDERFKVAIIRVPSIYNNEKREYFAQYELICQKFKCIPLSFTNCYRSAITVDNLCELIRLIIVNGATGIMCPDNGNYSASDYCVMSHPKLHRSRLIGFGVEKFLRWHPMVKSLFGAICYSSSISNLFDGKYRISK